jgi:hypothetical protein
MKAMCRTAVFAGAVASAALPVAAYASCEPGGTPAYSDVVGVIAYRYSLLQARPAPNFQLYVRRSNWGGNPPSSPRFEATLKTIKSAPLARGTYRAADAESMLKSVVAVLQKYDFFSLRLAPAKSPYVDGPDDFVAASRCGAVYSIGPGAPVDGSRWGWMIFGIDFDDPQYARFKAMLDEIRGLVFSATWIAQQPETASPSP